MFTKLKILCTILHTTAQIVKKQLLNKQHKYVWKYNYFFGPGVLSSAELRDDSNICVDDVEGYDVRYWQRISNRCCSQVCGNYYVVI